VTTTATADRPVVRGRPTGLRTRAATPVDAASTAVFRMALGAVVAGAMVRYLASGWVTALLTAPAFHVTYPGFAWVRPLPGGWMHAVVIVVALAGLAVAVGWRTRWSAAVALVGFLWIELVDAATYLNHYELVTLMLAWAVLLPLGTAWSLDARRAGRRAPEPRMRTPPRTVPSGTVWVLRAQLGVVYLFAGIAKLDPDWLLHGEPLGHWFAARTHVPMIGPLLGLPGAPLAASWAGALFDLTIVGFLLYRRTRPAAFAAVVAFHAVTGYLFPRIGIFPLAMVLLTPVFFSPAWPRRLARAIGTGAASPVDEDTRGVAPTTASRRIPRATVVLIAIVAVVQLALPVRHWVLGGDVAWDDYHSRWSWRVLVNERIGIASLDIVDPRTDDHTTVLPEAILPAHQARYVSSRPEALRQLAHHVADGVEDRTGRRPHVFVTAWVSINGSRRHEIVDHRVDLGVAPPAWTPRAWVRPPP
jgi:vitamin K-dependent gamma-carboxylase